jgi:hypothetical protein
MSATTVPQLAGGLMPERASVVVCVCVFVAPAV